MAALVANISDFKLEKALDISDLQRTCALYNTLVDDAKQPSVADEHVSNLAHLFTRHNAHKTLGIHLIHGHFKIPNDTVMLGTNFDNPTIRWAKITDTAQIDTAKVHGHIFVFTSDGLCAYELQDGPLPDFSEVGPQFLQEFVHYLVENKLTGLIGLQVLGCNDGSMSELILDDGTVMVDSSVLRNTVPSRVTGWKFEEVDGNPRVCMANETHSRMTTGNHKVFNAGKPHPKLENIDDLKAALHDAGVLLV